MHQQLEKLRQHNKVLRDIVQNIPKHQQELEDDPKDGIDVEDSHPMSTEIWNVSVLDNFKSPPWLPLTERQVQQNTSSCLRARCQ